MSAFSTLLEIDGIQNNNKSFLTIYYVDIWKLYFLILIQSTILMNHTNSTRIITLP